MLRGARPAGPPPRPSAEPGTAQRRASNTGVIMVAGQKIVLGRIHASAGRHRQRRRRHDHHRSRRGHPHRRALRLPSYARGRESTPILHSSRRTAGPRAVIYAENAPPTDWRPWFRAQRTVSRSEYLFIAALKGGHPLLHAEDAGWHGGSGLLRVIVCRAAVDADQGDDGRVAAQSVQAAGPSGADAADRNAQPGGDFGVRQWRVHGEQGD